MNNYVNRLSIALKYGDIRMIDKIPYSVSGFLITLGTFWNGMSWADTAAFIGIILGVLTFVFNIWYQRRRTNAYIKAIRSMAERGCIPPQK